MSKNALKRARMASADARLDLFTGGYVKGTHYNRGKRACPAPGATLSGNFAKGRARQAHEADQRDALEAHRIVKIEYPAPHDHAAHATFVALVATKYGA